MRDSVFPAQVHFWASVGNVSHWSDETAGEKCDIGECVYELIAVIKLQTDMVQVFV